tara:strand:+ start:4315 stop:5976 length:1662 start_codon:yes stop_codon:yes gene_type:complete
MAEVLTMQVNSNIGKVAKETKDFAKSLDEVNEQITIQNKVINDLEKDLINLKKQQDAIPKGGFFAGMGDLNKKIKETSNELKLEKLALKDLTNQQKDATQQVKKFNKAQKEQDDAVKGTIGNFQVFGISINGIKKNLSQVIPLIRLMFKSITAGLLSTGIGALLVAFGSLVTFIRSSKEGMDRFNVVLSKVSAIFKVLRDRVANIGKALADVFDEGLISTLKNIRNQFLGVSDEMQREVKIAGELTVAMQKLRDAENEFIVTKSATRKEIEKARLLSEDETKSAKERLEALQKALDLEVETSNKEIEMAKERKRIFEEDMIQSKHRAEDERKLAELTADIDRKEIASLRLQKRVMTEVNEMLNKIDQERKDRHEDLIEISKTEEEQVFKLIQVNEDYAKVIASRYKMSTKVAEGELGDQLKAAQVFAGGVSKLANENKALAGAEALISTYLAVQQTMSDNNIPSTALKFITAAGVLASGLANVRRIFATDVGGGSGGGSVPAATQQAPAPQMLSGSFELGGGEQPEPLKAFVVTDEMTNSQNQLANIRRRATI